MPIELASHVPGYRRRISPRTIIWAALGIPLAAMVWGTLKGELSFREKQSICENSTAIELADRQRQRARRCLEWPKEASAIMTACMTMASSNQQQQCVATPDPPLYSPEDPSLCPAIPPMRYNCGPQ